HPQPTSTKQAPSPDDHTAAPEPQAGRGARAPARAAQETRREPAPAPNRRPGPRPAPKAHAPSTVRPTGRAPGARWAGPGSGRLDEERFSRTGDKLAASFWDTVSL